LNCAMLANLSGGPPGLIIGAAVRDISLA
jgi:hypothetical protein